MHIYIYILGEEGSKIRKLSATTFNNDGEGSSRGGKKKRKL